MSVTHGDASHDELDDLATVELSDAFVQRYLDEQQQQQQEEEEQQPSHEQPAPHTSTPLAMCDVLVQSLLHDDADMDDGNESVDVRSSNSSNNDSSATAVTSLRTSLRACDAVLRETEDVLERFMTRLQAVQRDLHDVRGALARTARSLYNARAAEWVLWAAVSRLVLPPEVVQVLTQSSGEELTAAFAQCAHTLLRYLHYRKAAWQPVTAHGHHQRCHSDDGGVVVRGLALASSGGSSNNSSSSSLVTDAAAAAATTISVISNVRMPVLDVPPPPASLLPMVMSTTTTTAVAHDDDDKGDGEGGGAGHVVDTSVTMLFSSSSSSLPTATTTTTAAPTAAAAAVRMRDVRVPLVECRVYEELTTLLDNVTLCACVKMRALLSRKLLLLAEPNTNVCIHQSQTLLRYAFCVHFLRLAPTLLRHRVQRDHWRPTPSQHASATHEQQQLQRQHADHTALATSGQSPPRPPPPPPSHTHNTTASAPSAHIVSSSSSSSSGQQHEDAATLPYRIARALYAEFRHDYCVMLSTLYLRKVQDYVLACNTLEYNTTLAHADAHGGGGGSNSNRRSALPDRVYVLPLLTDARVLHGSTAAVSSSPSSSSPFVLGDRGVVVRRQRAPPLVPAVERALGRRHDYAETFRSMLRVVGDVLVHEYLFVLDFFACASPSLRDGSGSDSTCTDAHGKSRVSSDDYRGKGVDDVSDAAGVDDAAAVMAAVTRPMLQWVVDYVAEVVLTRSGSRHRRRSQEAATKDDEADDDDDGGGGGAVRRQLREVPYASVNTSARHDGYGLLLLIRLCSDAASRLRWQVQLGNSGIGGVYESLLALLWPAFMVTFDRQATCVHALAAQTSNSNKSTSTATAHGQQQQQPVHPMTFALAEYTATLLSIVHGGLADDERRAATHAAHVCSATPSPAMSTASSSAPTHTGSDGNSNNKATAPTGAARYIDLRQHHRTHSSSSSSSSSTAAGDFVDAAVTAATTTMSNSSNNSSGEGGGFAALRLRALQAMNEATLAAVDVAAATSTHTRSVALGDSANYTAALLSKVALMHLQYVEWLDKHAAAAAAAAATSTQDDDDAAAAVMHSSVVLNNLHHMLHVLRTRELLLCDDAAEVCRPATTTTTTTVTASVARNNNTVVAATDDGEGNEKATTTATAASQRHRRDSATVHAAYTYSDSESSDSDDDNDTANAHSGSAATRSLPLAPSQQQQQQQSPPRVLLHERANLSALTAAYEQHRVRFVAAVVRMHLPDVYDIVTHAEASAAAAARVLRTADAFVMHWRQSLRDVLHTVTQRIADAALQRELTAQVCMDCLLYNTRFHSIVATALERATTAATAAAAAAGAGHGGDKADDTAAATAAAGAGDVPLRPIRSLLVSNQLILQHLRSFATLPTQPTLASTLQ